MNQRKQKTSVAEILVFSFASFVVEKKNGIELNNTQII